MIRQLRTTFARDPGTVLSDAAGGMALVVILMVGLYLPGLM